MAGAVDLSLIRGGVQPAPERLFCADPPPRFRRLSQARNRSVATEDSACDRRAPLARWRVPPVASGQPCRSARRSCRGQAGAPPAAWHALGAAAARPQRRQVAPRRAVSAPCHRAGAPGAPMLRHRRSPQADRTAARRKQSWPDPLRRRQESPAKGTTQPHQCKGQRGGPKGQRKASRRPARHGHPLAASQLWAGTASPHSQRRRRATLSHERWSALARRAERALD